MKIANLMKPLTENLDVSIFRERCVKKQWLKRAERDANLAQEARRASIDFTKAALSQSNDDHIDFKARASDKLKDKKLRQIEHQLMCSKLPPFYEDPRAFVSIADCITRYRRANENLDVIDYGLETRNERPGCYRKQEEDARESVDHFSRHD